MSNKVVAIVAILIAAVMNFPLTLSIILGEIIMCFAIFPRKDGGMNLNIENIEEFNENNNIKNLIDMVIVFIGMETLLIVILFRFFNYFM